MAVRVSLQLRFVAVTAFAAVIFFLASTQTTEARKINLCSHTAYPSLCKPIVRKLISPRRATHRMIQILETRTKLAITNADGYRNGNEAMTTCYAVLNDAVYNLMSAKKSIRKRDVETMNTYLTAAVSDFGTCVDGFVQSKQVNIVQNAVGDLLKISTNCLALSTMIR